MPKVTFFQDLKICSDTCRLDDDALTYLWQKMEEQGFDPHSWHNAKERISNQQWYDALESELVRRGLA